MLPRRFTSHPALDEHRDVQVIELDIGVRLLLLLRRAVRRLWLWLWLCGGA
jgi:hypothetical protein